VAGQLHRFADLQIKNRKQVPWLRPRTSQVLDSFEATLSIRKTKRQRTNATDANESVTGNIVAIPNFRCDISEVLRCLGTHTGTAKKKGKQKKRKQALHR